MNAFNLRTAMLVAGLALVAGPALAQKAGGGGGGNGGNGGGGGNAGGGGAATGGNVAGSSSGSTSTTSTASSGFSSPSAGGSGSSASYRGGAMMRTTAPEHRTSFSYSGTQNNQHATPTATAAPRASSPRAGSTASSSQPRTDASHAVPRGSGSTQAATNNPAGNREVPSWSRNRGGRPSTGTAVPRSPDNPAPGSAAYYQYYLSRYGYYNPYFYDPAGIYGFYGFGGGYYGFYNPYYSPYGFGGYGLDPGFGYPYYGDPNDPYMYGEGYGSYSSRVYSGEGNGTLKLKVKPKDAKVYVDGYFAGLADQKLTLNGGNHKVEVKADGYETSEFDVLITPNKTLTFAGDLKKLQ
jgi:PEGA domain-containing protein